MDDKMTWEEACYAITNKIAETVIKKQRDYGPANINEFGELGILIRANDKMSRLKTLYRSKSAPENESIDDTWLDNAGYSVLALMYRNGTFKLKF